MSVTIWRSVVVVLLLLNLLVGCWDLHQNRTKGQSANQVPSLPSQTSPTSPASDSTEQVTWLVGRVVRVSDGDTVTILDAENRQHRVRLSQIDAPESKQPFSKVAKDALSSRIAAQAVQVKVAGTDRYQRVLGEIFIDQQNLNLWMVRQGYAWAYTQYVTDQRYFEAQEAAQRERVGLWRDPQPVPPWEYRRAQRQRR